jgi:hypothetical protein
VAVVDLDGFIASEKMHAIEHGFHVHDERHFIETYSFGQQWEVDLHPETACGGPLDLHMALEVDPRVVLAFEDRVLQDEREPEDDYHLPLYFNWVLPPLPSPPDLLVLATDLAGVAGTVLPVEVSATDSFESVTDAPQRSLAIRGSVYVSLVDISRADVHLCDVFDRCREISEFLLEQAPSWLSA